MARGWPICVSRVAPRAATGDVSLKQIVGVWLFVHDSQRPAPAGQLAGDGGVGDGVPLAALDELHPPLVQAPVALVAADAGSGRGSIDPSVLIEGLTGEPNLWRARAQSLTKRLGRRLAWGSSVPDTTVDQCPSLVRGAHTTRWQP